MLFVACPRSESPAFCSLCSSTRVSSASFPFEKSCVFDHFAAQSRVDGFRKCFSMMFTIDLTSSTSSVIIVGFDPTFIFSAQCDSLSHSQCVNCVSPIGERANCCLFDSNCVCYLFSRCVGHLNHETTKELCVKSKQTTTVSCSSIWNRLSSVWKDVMKKNLRNVLESNLFCVQSLDCLQRTTGFDFGNKFIRFSITSVEQV